MSLTRISHVYPKNIRKYSNTNERINLTTFYKSEKRQLDSKSKELLTKYRKGFIWKDI